VRDEYAISVNQKLVEGFLLRLHGLTRGTSEAHLFLCAFLIGTAHRESVPAVSLHKWAKLSKISSSQDMNALKHQSLVLPANVPDMSEPVGAWKPNSAEADFVLSCCICYRKKCSSSTCPFQKLASVDT